MFDVTLSGLLGAAGAACSALFVLPQLLKERRQRERHRPGTSTRRLRIGIDMDDVMADALSEHLRRYNTVFGTSLTTTHLQGCHLEDCVPPEHRSEAEAMIDASFFADLEVLPDCHAVVLELTQRYEVFIVS